MTSTLDDARGNYENRHPNDMVLHPLSEIREWDEALRELGIQDSDTTPAEAVRELNAEIERLRAAPVPQCDAGTGEPTNAQIEVAAKELWNDRDARMGGPWETRDPREVCVIQTKATARAMLKAALVSPPSEAGREMVQGDSDDASPPSGHPGRKFYQSHECEGYRAKVTIEWSMPETVEADLLPEWRAQTAEDIADAILAFAGRRMRQMVQAMRGYSPQTPLPDNRTGGASAEDVIVPIKSRDQGTVAVASAQCHPDCPCKPGKCIYPNCTCSIPSTLHSGGDAQ